jgi:hypothetical protein
MLTSLAFWLARLAKVFLPLFVSVVIAIIYDLGFFAAAHHWLRQALLVVRETLDRHRSVFVVCLIGFIVSASCNYPVAAPNETVENANNYPDVEHIVQAAIDNDQEVKPAIIAAVLDAPGVNPPRPEEPLPTAAPTAAPAAADADAVEARATEDAATNDDIMDAATLAIAALPANTADNEQQQQQEEEELIDLPVIANPTAVNLPPQTTHSRSLVAPQPQSLQSVQPSQSTNANQRNAARTTINKPQRMTPTRHSHHAAIATRSMLSNVARMPVPPPTIGPLSLSSATARDACSHEFELFESDSAIKQGGGCRLLPLRQRLE